MNEERLNQYDIPGEFPTKAVAVRRALDTHQRWIERMLGIPLNDAVILEVEVDLTQIGPERIFGTDDLEPIPTRTARRLRTLVADVEVPLDIPPMVEFVDHSVRNDWSDILGGATRRKGPHLEWRGCPIALRFHLAGIVMVAINIPYYDGPATTHESTARVVVARRDCAPQAIGLVQQIVRRDHQPRIVIQDGPAQRIIPCSWDDLVLDPSVLSLVRDDFESFFERKRWFRKNKVALIRARTTATLIASSKTLNTTAQPLFCWKTSTEHFQKRGNRRAT